MTTTSFDAESMVKLVEAAVQRQLMNNKQVVEQKLNLIEVSISQINEVLGHMGKSLNFLEEHNLHANEHGKEHMHGAGSGELHDVQTSLAEMRTRLENLVTMVSGRLHATAETVSWTVGSNSGKWWVWFVVAQVVMLVLFLVIRHKMNSREKKLL